MAKYELIFTLPYKLGAYDHVTLNQRLERDYSLISMIAASRQY